MKGQGSRLSRSSPPPSVPLGYYFDVNVMVIALLQPCSLSEIFHLAHSSACRMLARASSLPWGAICFPCTCGVELFVSPFILLSKQTLTSNTCILFTLQPEPKGKEAGLQKEKGRVLRGGAQASLFSSFLSKEAIGRLRRDSRSGSVGNNAYCLLIDRCILANAH